ncbi:MAG: putative resolvase [Nocardia sp.]|uniref:recombinase family protein n=1 Tax=Nocardia sp. TaxID=1821 RepID=UPI00262A275A|nr:recombinase family protein [Nocardia sp.]MCU1641588.1 putative resolvase [Nocardia sp.]
MIGYGRVSTPDQNPDHQTDALCAAGVAEPDIHLDIASGAKSSRPKFDLVMQLLRESDTVVVTRLDRLGRSLQHLVNLVRDTPTIHSPVQLQQNPHVSTEPDFEQ